MKGRFHQKIRETLIDGTGGRKHWRALEFSFARPLILRIADWLAADLPRRTAHSLSLLSNLLNAIYGYLGINTHLAFMGLQCDGKTERLANLCQQAAATDMSLAPRPVRMSMSACSTSLASR